MQAVEATIEAAEVALEELQRLFTGCGHVDVCGGQDLQTHFLIIVL